MRAILFGNKELEASTESRGRFNSFVEQRYRRAKFTVGENCKLVPVFGAESAKRSMDIGIELESVQGEKYFKYHCM